jgi:hypothetical protein
VIRVWLADRPGALGILTTALGEAGADVIGINILERDGGRAVDELTVSVPDEVTGDELARALSRLEAVQVEDVRSIVDRLPYPGSDPLDVAVELGQQRTPEALVKTLVHGVASVFAGDWAAMLRAGDEGTRVVVAGAPPPVGWLRAFVSGASSQQAGRSGELRGPSDVAWAVLEHCDASVVVGRGGPPFRSRERHQLVQLGRIADVRWRELAIRAGMVAHPSVGQNERTPAAS